MKLLFFNNSNIVFEELQFIDYASKCRWLNVKQNVKFELKFCKVIWDNNQSASFQHCSSRVWGVILVLVLLFCFVLFFVLFFVGVVFVVCCYYLVFVRFYEVQKYVGVNILKLTCFVVLIAVWQATCWCISNIG